VFKYFLKSKEASYFIMEMPVYRKPRWKNVGLTILEKVKVFLFESGKIILAVSVILWFLASFAPNNKFEQLEKEYNYKISQLDNSSSNAEVTILRNELASKKLEYSYAGVMGKTLEPIIEPLGFDWKIGISLVTSFAAREVFVGTMATIYSVGANEENTQNIREKMRIAKNPNTGEQSYTFAVAISLMLFYAFAMQCMSTIAVVYRETKSWKIPLFQFLYMGALAYLASYAAFNLLK